MAFLKLEPWSSSTENNNVDKSLTLGFILITLFVLVSTIFVGGQIGDILKQQTYTIFLLFILIISYASMGTVPSIYGGLGTKLDLYKGLLFGSVIGLVFLTISILTMSIPSLSIISSIQAISIFYAILVVPFAEEKFFGQLVPFILRRGLKSTTIAFSATCLIFGAFHYFAYYQSTAPDQFIGALAIAVAFRGLVLFGNEYLRTATFGITLHYFNNIAQVLRQLKTIGVV